MAIRIALRIQVFCSYGTGCGRAQSLSTSQRPALGHGRTLVLRQNSQPVLCHLLRNIRCTTRDHYARARRNDAYGFGDPASALRSRERHTSHAGAPNWQYLRCCYATYTGALGLICQRRPRRDYFQTRYQVRDQSSMRGAWTSDQYQARTFGDPQQCGKLQRVHRSRGSHLFVSRFMRAEPEIGKALTDSKTFAAIRAAEPALQHTPVLDPVSQKNQTELRPTARAGQNIRQ